MGGVCGKQESTAKLQDELVQAVKELAFCNQKLRENGQRDTEADHLTLEFLFATVTNVNFDDNKLADLLRQAKNVIDRLQKQTGAVLPEKVQRESLYADIFSLRELLLYGIKGTAAYADHALILGKEAEEIYVFFAKALSVLAQNSASMDELIALTMECGLVNLKAMELLDAGNTEHFGHPVPTSVRITPKRGKAILVSGHDLLDLEELLKQTEGKGINVYTHGEMLPAHAYPNLKKYPHLVGNYGGAWQDQHNEFAAFPGAVLMTTNCIQNPQGYENRIFTTGCVAWQGLVHIPDRKVGGVKDFTPVIEAALVAPGFTADGEEQTILTGFGHNAVMSVADKVIDAVKAGKIRHFFLIGGCDGAKSGRNYYTELAEKVPKDCVILTLACGKYRFNKLNFGDIDGIPRLLDIGQCNDAYSAIQIAVALAKAFDTDVNGLPLSMILSWYEQKAVCILLTLLALGVKNIKLGPSLPAFISPNVLNVLVEKFAIAPISTPENDLKMVL
ncbi:hydroxylamine reductase [Planctomycetales bacterium]|nr:hydroxylamine reductase [Planctomycetales bacterium]GHT35413.1 hydroxylamine reductase [Planctomycetales bacterium]